MRRNKTAAAGAICGVLCALCVLGYTQSVRGEAERARADALARYGGDQVEVCVAKRDIAAGETVDSGAIETRCGLPTSCRPKRCGKHRRLWGRRRLPRCFPERSFPQEGSARHRRR